MCDIDDDGPDAWQSTWRKARKEHACCACRETIRSGDVYRVSSGVWDGTPATFKHCARCWAIHEMLDEAGVEGVRLDLNCGETIESAGVADDLTDEQIEAFHALAFVSADEMQRRIAER
jgi:hypothetical protein